jgi:hypothetical protein
MGLNASASTDTDSLAIRLAGPSGSRSASASTATPTEQEMPRYERFCEKMRSLAVDPSHYMAYYTTYARGGGWYVMTLRDAKTIYGDAKHGNAPSDKFLEYMATVADGSDIVTAYADGRVAVSVVTIGTERHLRVGHWVIGWNERALAAPVSDHGTIVASRPVGTYALSSEAVDSLCVAVADWNATMLFGPTVGDVAAIAEAIERGNGSKASNDDFIDYILSKLTD